MTASVNPAKAERQLLALETLLDSYQLSCPEELVAQIRTCWQGARANDFLRKYAEIEEKLSANITCARLFCRQAQERLRGLKNLDNLQ